MNFDLRYLELTVSNTLTACGISETLSITVVMTMIKQNTPQTDKDNHPPKGVTDTTAGVADTGCISGPTISSDISVTSSGFCSSVTCGTINRIDSINILCFELI